MGLSLRRPTQRLGLRSCPPSSARASRALSTTGGTWRAAPRTVRPQAGLQLSGPGWATLPGSEPTLTKCLPKEKLSSGNGGPRRRDFGEVGLPRGAAPSPWSPSVTHTWGEKHPSPQCLPGHGGSRRAGHRLQWLRGGIRPVISAPFSWGHSSGTRTQGALFCSQASQVSRGGWGCGHAGESL